MRLSCNFGICTDDFNIVSMSQNFTKSLNWKQFEYCGGKYAGENKRGFSTAAELQHSCSVAVVAM